MVQMLVEEKFNADKLEDTPTQSGLLKFQEMIRKKRKVQTIQNWLQELQSYPNAPVWTVTEKGQVPIADK